MPYIDFSLHTSYFSATAWSASASSGKPSPYLSSNFFCFAGLSGLMPSTTVSPISRHASSPHACCRAARRVGLRVEVHEHLATLERRQLDLLPSWSSRVKSGAEAGRRERKRVTGPDRTQRIALRVGRYPSSVKVLGGISPRFPLCPNQSRGGVEQHRPLGGSGVDVWVISLGSSRTFERIPRDEGIEVIRAARDAGIDFLDDARYDDETGTAPIPTGWSEVVFGELVRASGWVGTRSWSPTSCGGSTGRTRRPSAELDGSLGRMGLDHVVVICAVRPPTLAVRRGRTGRGLIESGRAREWGTGMWPAALAAALDVCEEIGAADPWARRWGAASPTAGPAIRRCATRSIAGGSASSPATSSPGGRSAESTSRTPTSRDEPAWTTAPSPGAAGDRGSASLQLGEAWEVATAHLALAYALGHPNLASIVFGATNPEQVCANVGAGGRIRIPRRQPARHHRRPRLHGVMSRGCSGSLDGSCRRRRRVPCAWMRDGRVALGVT